MTRYAILQRGHTRTVNRAADKLSLSVKQLLADETRVRSADILTGMREGKVWRYHFPGARPAVEVLDLSSDLRDDYTLLAYLERGLQAAGYTETSFGQASVRGRPTLGEHEMRQAATLSHVMGMAKVFEMTFLENLVSRVKTHVFQYALDPSMNGRYATTVLGLVKDPAVRAALAVMTAETRDTLAATDFARANVRGMSEIIGRAERAQGLVYFMRMVGNLLQAVKGSQSEQQLHLNLYGLIYELGVAVGIHPRRLLGQAGEELAREGLPSQGAPMLPERAAFGAMATAPAPAWPAGNLGVGEAT